VKKDLCQLEYVVSISSQFHQHFTSAFFIQNFGAKKLQSQNVSREKLHKDFGTKKAPLKILMKLTPGK